MLFAGQGRGREERQEVKLGEEVGRGEKRGCGYRNRCKETNPGSIWRRSLQAQGGGWHRVSTRYAPFSLLNAHISSSRDTWVMMDDASI